ncbi:MAG TPA: TonB-dependent receptor plug domain-containing protein [Gemmatimonadales bacterium]|nr:TonB-dependent receptor plug domain-containing protein [Gemmatimonadales bacterium]
MFLRVGRPARPAARPIVGRAASARFPGALLGSLALCALLPGTALAQSPAAPAADSIVRARAAAFGPASVQLIPGELVPQLPVDSIQEVLRLQPGASTDAEGRLVVRAGTADELATYVDGIPVSPGYRGLAAGDIAGRSAGTALQLGVNTLEELDLVTGLAPVRFGHGRGGLVSVVTRRGGEHWDGDLGYERDGVIGGASFGFTRLRGSFGGPLGRAFRFFAAGVLDGRQSAPSGFGAADAPIFVAAGRDTTVTVDGTSLDVARYVLARGDCEARAKSADAALAETLGIDCSTSRTPGTAGSDFQALARLDFVPSARTRVGLLVLASQDQAHRFDYATAFLPTDQFGRRVTSSVAALTWDQAIGRGLLQSYVSRQSDRATEAPFASVAGAGTMGFYLKPYDFRYTDFKVDAQAVADYRSGSQNAGPLPATAREDNQSWSSLRSGPYGTRNVFVDQGGPDGRLNLLHETRTLAGTSLTTATGRGGILVLGGELTHFRLTNLSQRTTSTEPSELYVGSPRQMALWAEQTVRRGGLTVATGLRYDVFDSRAERPVFVCTAARDLDDSPLADGHCGSAAVGDTIATTRIFTNPDFDPGDPGANVRPDARHTLLSPRVRLGYALGARTELLAAWGQQAQAPDFSLVFAGINTDQGRTTTGYVFGSDLDLARTRTTEVGLRQGLGRQARLAVTGWQRRDAGFATTRLVRLYDPARMADTDFRFYTDSGVVRTAKGVDVRLDQRFGRTALATLAYGYQKGETKSAMGAFGSIPAGELTLPLAYARPHTVAATLALLVPGTAQSRSSDGLFGTFYWASGTSYTLCDPDPVQSNESVLSGDPCVRGNFVGGLNAARLPAIKRLDLRLAKTVAFGGGDLTLYVDARNALNWRSVRRVFVTTGTTANPREEQLAIVADSFALAFEAQQAGVYQPDGSVDLRFGGAGANGCAGYLDARTGSPSARAAADCVLLSRAEARWGNGDGVFTWAEQRAAFAAQYRAFRGEQALTDAPRQFRVGMALRF